MTYVVFEYLASNTVAVRIYCSLYMFMELKLDPKLGEQQREWIERVVLDMNGQHTGFVS